MADTQIRLALVRGDLDRVRRLLAQTEAPQRTLIRSTKLAPVAARLDALAALRERERLEMEAPRWLQPHTYLEPFALRALGVVRGDRVLVERAAACFDAMGAGTPPRPGRRSDDHATTCWTSSSGGSDAEAGRLSPPLRGGPCGGF